MPVFSSQVDKKRKKAIRMQNTGGGKGTLIPRAVIMYKLQQYVRLIQT